MTAHRKGTDSESQIKQACFGTLLQKLRGPDANEYRHAIALKRWMQQKRHRKTDINKGGADQISEIEREVAIPVSFREYSRRAVQLKIKATPLRETARLIGISKNTLHDYETGKRYPPAEFVFAFCNALGLSVERLMRDWVGFHPDPEIRKYAKEPCYLIDGVWRHGNGYMESGYFNASNADVVGCIRAAVDLATFFTGANVIAGRKTYEVACVTALILNRIIEKRQLLHPKNIVTNIHSYDFHLGRHSTDENGNIVEESEESEESEDEIW
jgi:transcriptional regulator with XRE-family HTH domain